MSSQEPYNLDESSDHEPSFLATLSAMLTSTFNQTATSQLTFAARPPRPPPNVPRDKLDALALDTGIKLLHDHIAYVRLNPIVTDCHAVTADSPEGRKLNVPHLLVEFRDSNIAAENVSSSTTTTTTFPRPIAPSPTDTESYSAHLSAGWTHYSVTDALPLPLGLPGTTTLTYTIALRNTPDGLETLVAAAGGVTIHGDIRVLRATEGRDAESGYRDTGAEKALWLQERTEVRCWVGTGWYVGKTLRESHESAHERFRGWWEREVRMGIGRMGGGGGQGQQEGRGEGQGQARGQGQGQG